MSCGLPTYDYHLLPPHCHPYKGKRSDQKLSWFMCNISPPIDTQAYIQYPLRILTHTDALTETEYTLRHGHNSPWKHTPEYL